jgi:hypothetical protein
MIVRRVRRRLTHAASHLWSGRVPRAAAVRDPTTGRTPRPPGPEAPRVPAGVHLLLPNFFGFSYPGLHLPLGPTRTMDPMHGSTFHASRSDHDARHARGPALTLVRGNGGSSAAYPRVVHRAHPAFPDFTPDGIPGTGTRIAVHDSGPESPTVRRMSRGSTSPDSDGSAHSGSGPHAPLAPVARRSAAAGVVRHPEPD